MRLGSCWPEQKATTAQVRVEFFLSPSGVLLARPFCHNCTGECCHNSEADKSKQPACPEASPVRARADYVHNPLGMAATHTAWLCTISATPKKGHLVLFALGDTQVPCGVTRPSKTTTSAQLGNTHEAHTVCAWGVPDGSTTDCPPFQSSPFHSVTQKGQVTPQLPWRS